MDTVEQRTRVVSWADQFAFAAAAGMNGLEFMRAMARGEIPPRR